MIKKELIALLQAISEYDLHTGCLSEELRVAVGKAVESEKTGISVPPVIREFVARYYSWLALNGGKKRILRKETVAAETALHRLVNLDGFDFEAEIVPAMRWAVQDAFWSAYVRNLGQLRAKSKKNGEIRFSNLFAAYSASKNKLKSAPINKTEIVNDERAERAAERIRQRRGNVGPGEAGPRLLG